MSDLRLTWSEFGYERKSFWRDPMSVFATLALPLLYLFIFVTNFGSHHEDVAGQAGPIKTSIYLVATIVSVAIVSATFFNVTTALVQEREGGILKRMRAAPLPTWVLHRRPRRQRRLRVGAADGAPRRARPARLRRSRPDHAASRRSRSHWRSAAFRFAASPSPSPSRCARPTPPQPRAWA